MRLLGLALIVGGICVLLLGLLVYAGALNWFGRLPGDIRYDGERVHVYIPIVSMLIASAVLSLIFYLVRKMF